MSENNRIDYIEFQVANLDESKEFYRNVFGWEFNDYGPSYAGIQDGHGGEIGGFEETDAINVGGPLVVLYSENLEQALADVEAAGAEICRPPFSFPGGRRFHFIDPSGHELAVWSK